MPESSGASVGFPGNCVPAPRKLFPGAGERLHSFTIEEKNVQILPAPGERVTSVPPAKKICRFPGTGETCAPAPRRHRGKITLIHCRRKMCRFSRRRGKPCPGAEKAAGERSYSLTMEEKFVSFPGAGGSRVPAKTVSRRRGKVTFIQRRRKIDNFPGAGGSCVPSPESSGARFWKGSGARFRRECRFCRHWGKLCAGAEKPVSRRRGKVTFIHYRRLISRFSRRWGKLCPGAGKAVSRRPGKVAFVQCRRKTCRFSRRRGKLCPGAGKPVAGALRRRGKLCP